MSELQLVDSLREHMKVSTSISEVEPSWPLNVYDSFKLKIVLKNDAPSNNYPHVSFKNIKLTVQNSKFTELLEDGNISIGEVLGNDGAKTVFVKMKAIEAYSQHPVLDQIQEFLAKVLVDFDVEFEPAFKARIEHNSIGQIRPQG